MNPDNDILDDIYSSVKLNSKGIYNLGLLFFITILVFLILTVLEYNYFPESWSTSDQPSIITTLTIMIMFLVNSILAPKYLNQYNPAMPIWQIILVSGFQILLITVSFKILQNLFIFKNGFVQSYVIYITSGILLSVLGMPISNIKIHHLRKNKLIWPSVILVTIWFVTIKFFI